MDSVWVCFDGDGEASVSCVREKRECGAYNDGKCMGNLFSGKPCCAVEYAPKRDLDSAIKERDLLQERCDELRKKIALMEEKG